MTRRMLLSIALALAAALGAGAAAGADLDELRSEGVIAERYDGYVELREEGSESAKALVERVNTRRRKLYENRAEEQGVAVDKVGKVYAEQIVEKAPDGTYFLRPNGDYVQK